MTELEKNKLKQLQIDMLKEFIRICENENLQWFVVGGTALGTVRHKGFIPWDDDIDVAMPREDYDKFMAVAQSYLPNHLFLQNINTDKEYIMNFAKIRDSRTTFVESSIASLKINHGVYIDVFCLDGFPNSKFSQKTFLFKDYILKLRIGNLFRKNLKVNRSFPKKIVDFILSIFYPDYKKTSYIREKLLKKYSYKEYDFIANYCGAWGKKEIMPKSIFGEGVKGTFEGLDVVLPEKTDEYLTHVYGNYMELPPIEKRVAHHYCDIVDLEKSYLEYMRK